MLNQIDKWFNKASDMAIVVIESEAKAILNKRPELDEFIMAMGSFFFTTKKAINSSPNKIIDEEDLNEPEFYKMVWELNEKFNCCGYPTRFTATGEKINDW